MLCGKDAVKDIHKIDPDVKVIISSGYSNDSVMADFGEYGFCAALVKLFYMRELMEVVAKDSFINNLYILLVFFDILCVGQTVT